MLNIIKILKCRLAESGPGNQFPGPEWATFWQFSDPQSAKNGSFPGPESTNPVLVTLPNSEQTTQLGVESDKGVFSSWPGMGYFLESANITGWSILTVKSNHTLKTEKISLSLKAKLFFSTTTNKVFDFWFKKISWSFSNYSSWKIFKVHKCESMENALKIKGFRKSILFCQYLWNGSSDLYEILCGGQLLSCELKFQILWRSVHKCTRTSCKRAHSR